MERYTYAATAGFLSAQSLRSGPYEFSDVSVKCCRDESGERQGRLVGLCMGHDQRASPVQTRATSKKQKLVGIKIPSLVAVTGMHGVFYVKVPQWDGADTALTGALRQ